MLDVAPMLPDFGGATLAGRRPGVGEFVRESVREGWWNTTLGAAGAVARESEGERRDPTPLSREEWQASGLSRQGMAWDERMTRGRAEAMARTFDDNAYRRSVLAARNADALDTVLGFGGQLVGSIPDPLNFVPVAGPLSRGLRAAGAVRAADALAAPGIAGSVRRGVTDATVGTAAGMPAIHSVQERYGEEVGFDRVVQELAIGALIGGGFGLAAGVIGRSLQPDTMAAVRTLDAAARDVAAGRSMQPPVAMASAAIEDAVVRAAPPEAAGMVRPDAPVGQRLDLPRAADGRALTRSEFAARLGEMARDARSRPVTMEDLDRADIQRGAASPMGRSVADLLAAMRRGEDRPRGEKSLAQFVVEAGGLRDDRGDVLNMMGAGVRTRPGLLNSRGLTPDLMAEKARAAGYFPEFGDAYDAMGRPTGETGADGFGMVAFLNALDEDLNKSRVRLGGTEDLRAREMQAALGDLDQFLERQGVSLLDPPDRIMAALRDMGEDAPSRTLDDLQRDEAAYAWYREAVEAQRAGERLAAAPPDVPARDPGDDAREGDAANPDPDMATVEAMRAEGRLTAADEAALRAGDDAAAELEAAANGLEGAAACLLRNAA